MATKAVTFSDKVSLVHEFEKKQGYPKDSLLNVMLFETANTLSTSIKNAAGSGAVGLFQFMPSTLKGFGLSTDQVAKMTFEQQLELCEKYLRPYRQTLLKTKDGIDFYLAILYPAAMGKPDSYKIADDPNSKKYIQNKGLDIDKDGDIEKGDVRKWFERSVANIRKRNSANPEKSSAGIGVITAIIVIGALLLLSKAN